MDYCPEDSGPELHSLWWLHADAFATFGALRGVRLEDCGYLGGRPGTDKLKGDMLEIGPVGISFGFQGFDPALVIAWDQISGVSVEGPDSKVRPTVTAGRALKAWGTSPIGLFSLLGKEKVAVLIVRTPTASSVAFQVGGYLWTELKSKLEPILQHYPAPPPSLPLPVTQSEPPTQPAVTVVAEQLRQLAQLRDSGVVTESEFQAKKTELLGRI